MRSSICYNRINTVLKFGELSRLTTRILSLFWAERVLSVNSERLIMEMADRLAEDGYRDAGYKYVSIDVSSVSGVHELVLFALQS